MGGTLEVTRDPFGESQKHLRRFSSIIIKLNRLSSVSSNHSLSVSIRNQKGNISLGDVHEKIIVLTISWSPVMMTSFPLSRSFKRKVLYHCKKTVQVSRRCSVHSFTFIFLCYFLLFFKLFTPQFPWDVYLHQWWLISCLFNSILIGDLTFISSVSCLGIISKDQNICSREACSLMYFKKTVSKRL